MYNTVCVCFVFSSCIFNEKDLYNMREINECLISRNAYSRTLNNIIYRAHARGQTGTSSRTHNRIGFNFTTVASRFCLVEPQSSREKGAERGGKKRAWYVSLRRFFRVVASTQIDFPLSTSTCDPVPMTAAISKSHDGFFFLYVLFFLYLLLLNSRTQSKHF